MQNHFSCQQMCLQSICFRRVVCSHSCLRAVRGDDSWNHSSSVFHRGCGVLSMGSCARALSTLPCSRVKWRRCYALKGKEGQRDLCYFPETFDVGY